MPYLINDRVDRSLISDGVNNTGIIVPIIIYDLIYAFLKLIISLIICIA